MNLTQPVICFHMVGALGIEPRTGRLKVCCDNRFTILRIGLVCIEIYFTCLTKADTEQWETLSFSTLHVVLSFKN